MAKFFHIKKQWITAGTFLLILCWLFICVSYILRPQGDARKKAYAGFYYEKPDSIDMLFIGSSPVYPYYAPTWFWNQYGITGSLLSSSVQPPDDMIYLMKEARKTQKPELFILELRMFIVDENAFLKEEAIYDQRMVLDNLKYSFNRLALVHETTKAGGWHLEDYIDLVRYHGNWKSFVGEDLGYYDFEKNDPYKGFLFKPEIEAQTAADFSEDTSCRPIPAKREEQLREILDYCRRYELQPLFLISPYIQDGNAKRMFNYMGKIIEEEYGYPFLNMNDHVAEIGIDYATDFYNEGHANIHGAVKCMRYLGDYIVAHFSVCREHDADTTAHWNADYAVWNAAFESTWQAWEENRRLQEAASAS